MTDFKTFSVAKFSFLAFSSAFIVLIWVCISLYSSPMETLNYAMDLSTSFSNPSKNLSTSPITLCLASRICLRIACSSMVLLEIWSRISSLILSSSLTCDSRLKETSFTTWWMLNHSWCTFRICHMFSIVCAPQCAHPHTWGIRATDNPGFYRSWRWFPLGGKHIVLACTLILTFLSFRKFQF